MICNPNKAVVFESSCFWAGVSLSSVPGTLRRLPSAKLPHSTPRCSMALFLASFSSNRVSSDHDILRLNENGSHSSPSCFNFFNLFRHGGCHCRDLTMYRRFVLPGSTFQSSLRNNVLGTMITTHCPLEP